MSSMVLKCFKMSGQIWLLIISTDVTYYHWPMLLLLPHTYRDGEDTDELLERQADMIRYLQQHNANLGRRILELQSQNME